MQTEPALVRVDIQFYKRRFQRVAVVIEVIFRKFRNAPVSLAAMPNIVSVFAFTPGWHDDDIKIANRTAVHEDGLGGINPHGLAAFRAEVRTFHLVMKAPPDFPVLKNFGPRNFVPKDHNGCEVCFHFWY